MARSTASAMVLVLLGALYLTNAAPAPVNKLDSFVWIFQVLFDELKRLDHDIRLQQEECEYPTSVPSDTSNSDIPVAVPVFPIYPDSSPSKEHVISGYTGTNKLNYGNGGNGMHIFGK